MLGLSEKKIMVLPGRLRPQLVHIDISRSMRVSIILQANTHFEGVLFMLHDERRAGRGNREYPGRLSIGLEARENVPGLLPEGFWFCEHILGYFSSENRSDTCKFQLLGSPART
jgi:hypothetical protein